MSYWKISTWIISAPHYQGIGYTLRKRNMLNDATNNSVWYAVLSRSVVSDSLWPHGLQPTRLLCPWGFSRQEYWSGCHALLQGIFQTQGLNPGLLHWRWILYRLSHQGSSRILEWVAIPSPGDLPNPGIKPGFPHCQQILYQLSYQGSPKNSLTRCKMWEFYRINNGFFPNPSETANGKIRKA